MNTKRNLISTILLQVTAILSGLILPRIIISGFGSEVNGLVATITQYLSIISIVEGGLGAVVLAELYKPIEDRDMFRIMSIYKTSRAFFKQIGVIFIIYTVFLCVFYPVISNSRYDFGSVSSLVLILSISTFIQYFFSITYRLIIEANQNLYICNCIGTITTILNILSTVVLMKLYPSIHFVKLVSAFVFLIQPIFFSYYVKKKKYIDYSSSYEIIPLKNRWSGFAQNLAHFINMNTDIIVISTFLGLTEVSVYSVYCMASNQLKALMSRVTGAYQSNLGKQLAKGNKEELLAKFTDYIQITQMFSTIMISVCILLNTQFVQLYTSDVHDADYFRPLFTVVMGWAQFIFCIREPYRYLVLSAGKFKETNIGSFVEAGLNIVITLALITHIGIVGAAVGTLVAILYRLIYFIIYLHKNIIYISIIHIIKYLTSAFCVMGMATFMALYFPLNIKNFVEFIIYGFISVLLVSLLYFVLSSIIEGNNKFTYFSKFIQKVR